VQRTGRAGRVTAATRDLRHSTSTWTPRQEFAALNAFLLPLFLLLCYRTRTVRVQTGASPSEQGGDESGGVAVPKVPQVRGRHCGGWERTPAASYVYPVRVRGVRGSGVQAARSGRAGPADRQDRRSRQTALTATDRWPEYGPRVHGPSRRIHRKDPLRFVPAVFGLPLTPARGFAREPFPLHPYDTSES
jgi:hypothetical protein